MQQRQGVAPARKGQNDWGPGDRLSPSRIPALGQPRVQPGEDPAGQAVGIGCAQVQAARVRSCAARVFSAAGAASA